MYLRYNLMRDHARISSTKLKQQLQVLKYHDTISIDVCFTA
jgi:hypothetical protein